jgi:hypothetical protein
MENVEQPPSAVLSKSRRGRLLHINQKFFTEKPAATPQKKYLYAIKFCLVRPYKEWLCAMHISRSGLPSRLQYGMMMAKAGFSGKLGLPGQGSRTVRRAEMGKD